jgi:hypothetical protein
MSQGKIRGCVRGAWRVLDICTEGRGGFWLFTARVSNSTLCYQLGNRMYCWQVELEYFCRILGHNKIVKTMDVLFSTLIGVFANVLSTSRLISDVLAFDSAICNKELRTSYLDFLSSERVVMDDKLSFKFEMSLR